MTTFEDLFNKSVLSVVTPESSVSFPSQDDPTTWEKWVERVEDETTDRKLAFFDENLELVLALRFEHVSFDSGTDGHKPPSELLSFLAHVQISYEATYITSLPQALSPSPFDAGRPGVPPRSHSMPGRNKPTPLVPPHPSIFPPHTPHPIPSSTESDRQYVQAQGTPLRSGIWGDGSASSGSEAFALIWSKRDNCWVAVFKMAIQVVYIPTKVADPLLCLTVSATLREKPVAVTPVRRALTALIEASGTLSPDDPTTPLKRSAQQDEEDLLNGLEEVNLLDGLTGPTFAPQETPLTLPSSRLGESIRKQAFGIITRDTHLASPTTSTPTTYRASHPTLRKAFRKTLRTVSGFRVRMRTVFVPYFMLPQNIKKSKKSRMSLTDQSADSDSDEDPLDVHERELREAGNEEHTVVLCVEVENGGETSAGFAVESVKVTVGGDGAQTHLIGWGDSGFLQSDLVFPLRIGPHEQYNLLYAVTFTRSPEVDEFSLARGRGLPGVPMLQEMQRAVAIIINGKPFEVVRTDDDTDRPVKPEEFTYPTATFPSRWNCILDLSPQANSVRRISTGPGEAQLEVMPTPASPFPGAISGTRPTSAPLIHSGTLIKPGTPGQTKPPAPIVAGSKRFTMSAMDAQASEGYFDSIKSRLTSPVNYRSGTSLLNPANQRDTNAQSGFQPSGPSTPTVGLTVNTLTQGRPSYIPPSATMKTFSRTTPTTTYGPLSPPLPSLPSLPRPHSYGHIPDDSLSSQIADIIPPTPAYPAFPTSPPPTTPHWQGPIANMQSGAVGPSVEIRREKGPNAAGIPPTPGPRVSAAGGFVQMQSQGETLRDVVAADGPGEPIVVSVGLLRDADGDRAIGKIYPLDQFTLDIFVFNRSSWTRRFEVSYPDRRKQRREKMYFEGRDGMDSKMSGSADTPGIIPLANRVRIGPLLPSTCQSVRMDFLALAPGVHSVDTLVLTDIQSGFSMNLRSAMDVVVHEPELPRGSSEVAVENQLEFDRIPPVARIR